MHHSKKKVTKKLWLVKDVLTGDATRIHSACHHENLILLLKIVLARCQQQAGWQHP